MALKLLAFVGFAPNAFGFMPAQSHTLCPKKCPSRESEFSGIQRLRHCPHSGASTSLPEPPPEPWQIVSLAEDQAFWLALQGEIFDGSVQAHELER
jgi:hypothetical protein